MAKEGRDGRARLDAARIGNGAGEVDVAVRQRVRRARAVLLQPGGDDQKGHRELMAAHLHTRSA
eukprot:1562546-Prymnesium_polylepis.1